MSENKLLIRARSKEHARAILAYFESKGKQYPDADIDAFMQRQGHADGDLYGFRDKNLYTSSPWEGDVCDFESLEEYLDSHPKEERVIEVQLSSGCSAIVTRDGFKIGNRIYPHDALERLFLASLRIKYEEAEK
jgi:hypothetical protein